MRYSATLLSVKLFTYLLERLPFWCLSDRNNVFHAVSGAKLATPVIAYSWSNSFSVNILRITCSLYCYFHDHRTEALLVVAWQAHCIQYKKYWLDITTTRNTWEYFVDAMSSSSSHSLKLNVYLTHCTIL